MTNIVMLVKDRPRLTHQALSSLAQKTDAKDYTITVIDDGSDVPLEEQGWVQRFFPNNGTILRISPSQHITGKARNLGIWWSEKYWGRGDWLYLSDNDVAFKSGWLPKLTSMATGFQETKVLGGYRHPYHGVNGRGHWQDEKDSILEFVDAVAGYSQLMRWDTYEKYGPFDGNAAGTCQSEDFAFCQRIIADGGKVGYVNPSVISVCGITNTEGKPATGWETFKREPGLVYE